MSVNQDTDVSGTEAGPGSIGKPRAVKDDARTDMVGKALGLLVLLGDEPRGASAAELSR
ncbi:transcriptional regulator protein, partial [Arthrobacter sp. Hiyo6]